MNDEQLRRELLAFPGWSDFTATVWTRADFRCEYCGCDMLATHAAYEGFNREHVIPEGKGGAGDPSNIALSCRGCNVEERRLDREDPALPGTSREDRIAHVAAQLAQHDRDEADLPQIRSLVEQWRSSGS